MVLHFLIGITGIGITGILGRVNLLLYEASERPTPAKKFFSASLARFGGIGKMLYLCTQNWPRALRAFQEFNGLRPFKKFKRFIAV